MPSVWVDIDLNDVSTFDLLDELESRYLEVWHKNKLLEMLKDYRDTNKWDVFLKAKDRYNVGQLEELFKEDFSVKEIPKEQLGLFKVES